MTPITLSLDAEDAALVERSLAGDRQAFSRIVARYQSLVCALAYSATGNRCRSEDLAQETFLSAWRNLRALREPGRLRSWLCGIARNVIHGEIRRLGRQPVHAADALDAVETIASAEPAPAAQAVTNEEMAILWREVGRLPETYREPIVLFYREHKSVEVVAEALDLTPEAVMQRLSRGRRLLQERMLEFIETTLERSNPGPTFTLQVTAALPLIAGVGPAAAAGAAGQGAIAAKGGWAGMVIAWVAPFLGVVAAAAVSVTEIIQAPTARERRFVIRWTAALWLLVAAFVVAMPVVGRMAHKAGLDRRTDWTATAPMVAVWFGYTLLAMTMIVVLLRGKVALRRQMLAAGQAAPSRLRPITRAQRLVLALTSLSALFWVLVFVASQTGDHGVALAIAAVVIALAMLPAAIAPMREAPQDGTRSHGWYLATCGLVFLALLNWRLDVWLAPVYHVDLAAMHQLLPMPLVHGASAVVVGWTALLVYLTRPPSAER